MIQMINLKKQFDEIKADVLEALVEVLETTRYVLGPKVKEFEEKVANYTGTTEAIGVANGTDALHLALKSFAIEKGDEVITTPFTFFATVEAPMYEGAKPVFVDIDPVTFNMDPAQIESKINERTKAILPVHMFGHPANMEPILELALKYRLTVIEDCAQAFGATINGRKVGSLGDAGCFSFYPSKNLGAFGDAGMITLDYSEIAEDIRKFRNHGTVGPYLHADVGFNSRLDEMQAAILLVKLKRIEDYNEKRRQKAALYTRLLADAVVCPVERPGCRHVYHQYTIRSPRRDEIKARLDAAGIASTVYYPTPMHMQPALAHLGYRQGDFPHAEAAAREVLSLPICPMLEDSDIERIASIVRSV